MRRTIAVAMLSVCLTGCTKLVTVPSPPDVVAAQKQILEAPQIPAADKAKMLEDTLKYLQETYRMELERASQAAQNVKDTADQWFKALLAAVATWGLFR